MRVENRARLLPPSTVSYIHDQAPTLSSFPIAGFDFAHYSKVSSVFLEPAIWAMNAFPAGTRVYYWTPTGATIYGTVQSSSFLEDGTQILTIVEDSGRICTLPAVGINRVS
ncbi:hypothetical protein Agabi119p4_3180 [Agaricus bisporus var. burnettii]|uniref:Uncharacterized protein n=1 Tax=Agaricus bisporus var. burnettii TaxID=192524 RepID=A0A8H7KIP3_AGABI|nr:hypothetical protein AGABI2DRAFT_216653 [Agaricus bisporus var. bisporus H97]EKV50199.1 hypothetical protein AGABI2DRAFT_216653 [Agaricus bisporus var. bisporus H97]KAF7778835.1 hypothetical protein Agabi119p4_3180 [Agaricus bisporus var. burnettii]